MFDYKTINKAEVLVIYHKQSCTIDCVDGFASAVIAWTIFGDSAQYLPGLHYKKVELSAFKNRHVLFVDFAYEVAYMDEIAKVAASLMVVDHHKTTMFELGIRPYSRISLTQCAATLLWQFFYPEKPAPLLLKYIEDHDLGTFADEDTKPLIQYLKGLPPDFELWGRLLNKTFFDGELQKGHILLQNYEHKCRQLLPAAFPIVLGGVRGLALNCSKFFFHDVGELLAQESGTYGATFMMRSDTQVEFGLTSVSDFDVEKIAIKYHGGGHNNVAGFSIPLSSFSSIVDLSNKNVSFYLNVQSLLDTFGSTLSIPADLNLKTLSTYVLQALSNFLAAKLGDVADGLQLKVDVAYPIQHSTLRHKVSSFLAQLFTLPYKETEERWYHKFFPYEIMRPVVFDDAFIAELLELSKHATDPDTRSFVVNNLMQTVKREYEAVLKLRVFNITITVQFPDSSFFVQHKFTI